MKLEEGKFYRTKNGKKAGPMRIIDRGRFRWIGDIEGGWADAKFLDGGSWGDAAAGWDLVAEWTDEVPVTKASLLDAAKAAVADRGLNYGKPEDNFLRIARLWVTHFVNQGVDIAISPADVAQMMILMKVARLENAPDHLDSWTDIAGYSACGAEITNG